MVLKTLGAESGPKNAHSTLIEGILCPGFVGIASPCVRHFSVHAWTKTTKNEHLPRQNLD
jgi:hypothetical protein